MSRASLTGGPYPTGPAQASLSRKGALLEPAAEQYVHHPNYRQGLLSGAAKFLPAVGPPLTALL